MYSGAAPPRCIGIQQAFGFDPEAHWQTLQQWQIYVSLEQVSSADLLAIEFPAKLDLQRQLHAIITCIVIRIIKS